MNIRLYEPKDRAAVEAIHARQGFAYDFPDLEKPTWMIRLVGEDEGQIVQAAFAHLTAEIFFMIDPAKGTPQERHFGFLQMQDVGRELAYKPGGLDDLHAFLPPPIERKFARRLVRHGWRKALWPAYWCDVTGVT